MQSTQPPQLMKTKTSIIVLSLAAGIVLSALGGCASVGSTNTESLLSAAGFVVRTPQTDRQKQIYAALPPYKVERATIQGKGVFYVYKDEKAGVAYVGREEEYQRYKNLAIQQRIAEDNYIAEEMDRQAALGWYGGYGMRRIW